MQSLSSLGKIIAFIVLLKMTLSYKKRRDNNQHILSELLDVGTTDVLMNKDFWDIEVAACFFASLPPSEKNHA